MKTQSTIDRIIQTAQNKTPFIGPDELTKWLVERGWNVRSTQSFDSLGYHDLRVFPLNPSPAPWCIDGCTHPSEWPKFCAAIVKHFKLDEPQQVDQLDQDANLAKALEAAWDKHFVAGGLKFNSWVAVAKRARELLQPAQCDNQQGHERSPMERVSKLEVDLRELAQSCRNHVNDFSQHSNGTALLGRVTALENNQVRMAKKDQLADLKDRVTELESKLRAEVDERQTESKVIHKALESHSAYICGQGQDINILREDGNAISASTKAALVELKKQLLTNTANTADAQADVHTLKEDVKSIQARLLLMDGAITQNARAVNDRLNTQTANFATYGGAYSELKSRQDKLTARVDSHDIGITNNAEVFLNKLDKIVARLDVIEMRIG